MLVRTGPNATTAAKRLIANPTLTYVNLFFMPLSFPDTILEKQKASASF
jgi:hypothetical protein